MPQQKIIADEQITGLSSAGGVVGRNAGSYISSGTVLDVLGSFSASGSVMSLNAKKTTILVTATAGASSAWTNMPANDTAMSAVALMDLRGFTKARIFGSFGSVAPASLGFTHLHAMYSVNSGVTFSELAPTPVSLNDGRLMWVTSQYGQSGWFLIPAAAAAENAWIRIYGTGGNGTADPTYNTIGIEFA